MENSSDKLRKRIYEIIQIGSRGDIVSQIADYVIVAAIILNIVALYVGTFPLPQRVDRWIDVIEYGTLVIFIIEYGLRIWTADYQYPKSGPIEARLKYIFSFFGLVDLLSILPYFIAMMPWGMVAFRILRVFRIFRLFKINAQYDAFNIVIDVLIGKRRQIMSSVVIVLTMMLAASLLMYGLEHEAQPEVFKNAFSGLWWSVSTLLTVGYGDIYPVTTLGKIAAIVLSLLGVGLVAIPTGIISAGFVEQYTKMKPLDTMSEGKDIKFINISIEDAHPWVGLTLRQIVLPPELVVVAVIRGEQIIIPRGDTFVRPEDEMILGALEYQGEHGIHAQEFMIDDEHPWNGEYLKDLSIPNDMVIVSVIRHGRAIIPKGTTLFHPGDLVTVCVHWARTAR